MESLKPCKVHAYTTQLLHAGLWAEHLPRGRVLFGVPPAYAEVSEHSVTKGQSQSCSMCTLVAYNTAPVRTPFVCNTIPWRKLQHSKT